MSAEIVGKCVARVDLDEVMNEQQANRVRHVGAWPGVFCEDERHHREMPRVLGAVLTARTIDERGTAQDSLETVDFLQEGDLLLDATSNHAVILSRNDSSLALEPTRASALGNRLRQRLEWRSPALRGSSAITTARIRA